MELTISRQELEAHRERGEVLWFKPGGGCVADAYRSEEAQSKRDALLAWAEDLYRFAAAYWAAEPRGERDALLAWAEELYRFAPAEGERSLEVGMLTFGVSDDLAEQEWLDETYDMIVVSYEPLMHIARLFGPLRDRARHLACQQFGSGDGMRCLPDGVWQWEPMDGPIATASSWHGAMGMML